jgi:hypothetical protein
MKIHTPNANAHETRACPRQCLVPNGCSLSVVSLSVVSLSLCSVSLSV